MPAAAVMHLMLLWPAVPLPLGSQSGFIVVDGVLASCHGAWPLVDGLVPTALVPWLPSLYQAVHALWHPLYRLLHPTSMRWLSSRFPLTDLSNGVLSYGGTLF